MGMNGRRTTAHLSRSRNNKLVEVYLVAVTTNWSKNSSEISDLARKTREVCSGAKCHRHSKYNSEHKLYNTEHKVRHDNRRAKRKQNSQRS